MKSNLKQIKSLCIVRLSAIGDVTHVLPVIATLQKTNPKIEITWVIGKLEHKLMQGLPGVNFVIFDKKRGSIAYKEIKQRFRNTVFDALLQMQYSFRANRLSWKIKAKMRIGFDKKRARELHGFRLTHRIKAVERQHVLDGFMEFLKPLGIQEKCFEWNITTSKADKDFVNTIVQKGKLNVVLSPCSSIKLKNWSNDRYIQVVDYLIQEYDAHIILCGGPSKYEIETSAIIEKGVNGAITNITGKDTLKQLFVLLKSVDLVISPDSGPMHMASAARTPVIGLHATSTAKRSGPYLYQHLTIDCFNQAAELFLKKSAEKIRWGGQIRKPGVMDLITVKSVKEKINSVFNKRA